MITFSENGNDFVGRLLHEGGVSRRTFSAFPQTQTAGTARRCDNYSTTPRNGNRTNGNHLDQSLSSPQKNGN